MQEQILTNKASLRFACGAKGLFSLEGNLNVCFPQII